MYGDRVGRVWTHDNRPRVCRNGHRLGPYEVLVGFRHCQCGKQIGGGHLTWKCVTCNDVQWSDGHEASDDAAIPDARPGPRSALS